MRTQERNNLLFLLQTFRTGGSERIVKDLCENLDSTKFKCFVLALVGGEMQQEFEEKGVTVNCVDKRGHDTFNIMRRISAFVKTHQIHTINAHHFTPFLHGFYGAKIHGCKIIFTAHTCNEIDLIDNFWSLIGRILLRFSHGTIGISHDISESMIKKFHLRQDKVYTIVNAINHKRFEIDVDVRAKKEELNLEGEDKVIGSVGTLGRQKNYPNLIRAFKIVQGRMNSVKLLIIGEGKRRNELEFLVKDLGLDGKVLLLGARLDVPEIMKVLDIYCLPSLFEGLPLSLLEAMSAGLPVVGTDVVGVRNVIMNERTGLLVPSENPEELAKALIKLLMNPDLAKELSKNGHRYVLEEHSMAKWIREYEQLFA